MQKIECPMCGCEITPPTDSAEVLRTALEKIANKPVIVTEKAAYLNGWIEEVKSMAFEAISTTPKTPEPSVERVNAPETGEDD